MNKICFGISALFFGMALSACGDSACDAFRDCCAAIDASSPATCEVPDGGDLVCEAAQNVFVAQLQAASEAVPAACQ